LKLLTRMYDATEGQVLVDGKDIRTLRAKDVRDTIAVLFQDFTVFPLSVSQMLTYPDAARFHVLPKLHENIALGDPGNAHDDAVVQTAARLAGIDFEHRLPRGLHTYLDVRRFHMMNPQ
jgi:ABC-type multidrug transport system fused ATPase/permease subunit